MMTTERPTEAVAWGALDRRTKHRTSAPTDRAVRAAVADLAGRGRRPNADAVILAALRLVDPAALRAEVRKVEAETHDPRPADDE